MVFLKWCRYYGDQSNCNSCCCRIGVLVGAFTHLWKRMKSLRISDCYLESSEVVFDGLGTRNCRKVKCTRFHFQ